MITDAPIDAAAADYLRRVRLALGDLPADERDELLADLAEHLTALAAEGTPIADRLGTPEAYAAELRASAGLAEPAPVSRVPRREMVRQRWRTSAAARLLRPHAPELRAAWWVVRAWMAVAWLALATSSRTDSVVPPAVRDSRLLGIVVLAAAIALSIHIGKGRSATTRRRLDVVLSVLGVAGVIGVMGAGDTREYVYQDVPRPPMGPSTADGRTLTNVWAFDADGNLLEDVYLFDQDGRPLISADVEAAVPLDADGSPIDNLYPQHSLSVDPTTGRYRVDELRPPTVFLPDRGNADQYVLSSADHALAMPPEVGGAPIAPVTTGSAVVVGGDGAAPSAAPSTTAAPASPSTTTPVPTTTAATVRTTATTGATILVPALDPNAPPVEVPAP